MTHFSRCRPTNDAYSSLAPVPWVSNASQYIQDLVLSLLHAGSCPQSPVCSAVFHLLFGHFSLLRKYFAFYLISFYWMLFKHSSICLNIIITLLSRVFAIHPNLYRVQLSIGARWENLIQYFPPVSFRSEVLARMVWFCGAFQSWHGTHGSIETSSTSFPYESHTSELLQKTILPLLCSLACAQSLRTLCELIGCLLKVCNYLHQE